MFVGQPSPRGQHPRGPDIRDLAATVATTRRTCGTTSPTARTPAERLDVYRPATAHHDPIIVMVHGGGWRHGDQSAAAVIVHKVAYFLPRGYLLVSTNYPMASATEARSIASAVAYTQSHAPSWGGDPANVVLMGHSAGANLVSLIAADPAYAAHAGAQPWLGTIALDSAADNVPAIMKAPHRPLDNQVFGHDTRLWNASSPALVLSETPAPMLLVCSTGRTNSCPQARSYAAAVRRHQGTATLQPVDLTHQHARLQPESSPERHGTSR